MITTLWQRLCAFINRLLQHEPNGGGWDCYGDHDDD